MKLLRTWIIEDELDLQNYLDFQDGDIEELARIYSDDPLDYCEGCEICAALMEYREGKEGGAN